MHVVSKLRGVMKKILLLIVVLFSNQSFACSCGGADILRMDKGAELVVLAELKAKRKFYSFTNNKYIFSAVKTFKGLNTNSIEVWTPKFGVSCGLQPDYGMPYILFVYREDNKLRVDHCSSWPLTKNYFDYTHEFNEFYKLTDSEALKPDSKE
jgi:hypothetical protein